MDKTYWEDYYRKQNDNLNPSLFARYVMENIANPNNTMVELGCGNGRDAIYFANEGLQVLAIDQCETEIKFLQFRHKHLKNLTFQAADFSDISDNRKFDIVYSRFTLHSVSKEQELRTLAWAYENLKTGGGFCIEVRGQQNEIYQVGKKVENEQDAYIYNNHYRRFLNFDKLCDDLKAFGFRLKYAAEEKGFAPFAGKDETYIRIIAQKIKV